MSGRRSKQLAWALLALSVALLAASLVLAALSGFDRAYDWGTSTGSPFFIGAPCTAFAVVGALIASQREDNAMGWVCLAVGLLMTATVTAGQYALYTLETNPGALPAGELSAWVGQWDWIVFVSLIGIYLPLLFPDGRLPSPRWRVVAWLGVAAILATAAYESLHPGLLPNYAVENPAAVTGVDGLLAVLETVGYLLLIGCLLASAAPPPLRHLTS